MIYLLNFIWTIREQIYALSNFSHEGNASRFQQLWTISVTSRLQQNITYASENTIRLLETCGFQTRKRHIRIISWRKTSKILERKRKKKSCWMQSPFITKILNNLFTETGRSSGTFTVNGSHVAKQTDGNIYSRRRVFCRSGRRDKVCTCVRLVTQRSRRWKIGEPGRGEVRSRRIASHAADVMNFFHFLQRVYYLGVNSEENSASEKTWFTVSFSSNV